MSETVRMTISRDYVLNKETSDHNDRLIWPPPDTKQVLCVQGHRNVRVKSAKVRDLAESEILMLLY